MKLIDLFRELVKKKFYGSITFHFQHGKIVNVEQKISRTDIVIDAG